MSVLMRFVFVLVINSALLNVDANPFINASQSVKISNPKGRDSACVCVRIYQCDESGHVITDGAGMIDPRKRRPRSDTSDQNTCANSVEEICCLPPAVERTTSITDTPTTADVTTVVPWTTTPASTTINTILPHQHQCGTRSGSSSPFSSRIMSTGRDGSTRAGEFPWQVAILLKRGMKKIFVGAAVLIDQNYVLTAAHKISTMDMSFLILRVGAWNLSTNSQPREFQDFYVTTVNIHPNFNNVTLKNDVAVLGLDRPVVFSPTVETVCLPREDERHNGQNCFVTGWGKDAFVEGKHSAVLLQVSVPVVPSETCQTQLRATRLGQFFNLDKSFICAGGKQGMDACVGDGGGPLVCPRNDGTFSLVGLVAWGIDCGQLDVPGVYVNIKVFLNYITDVTQLPLDSFQPVSSN